MRVWRLVKHARVGEAWRGEGARLNPGRWNRGGQRVIYTSDSAALATLEIIARAQSTKALEGYTLLAADLPDDSVQLMGPLPEGWQDMPGASMADFAESWFSAGNLALRVPSSIAPGYNVLINPGHKEWKTFRPVSNPPQLHARLWKGL